MKIISLQAENVKRLTAVSITPDGNLVQISGRNGQGKTSVLDAIWWALEGAANIQAEPIRKGADEAQRKVFARQCLDQTDPVARPLELGGAP